MPGFGFLSTYPPTRCGLATFTDSLASAMTYPGEPASAVVRMIDETVRPGDAPVGARVRVVAELPSFGPRDPAALAAAARALNRGPVAIVQHEYGIYGGTDGDDVIAVLERVEVPIIVVLHTVLDRPSPGQRRVIERVAALADAVVVMTEAARSRLERHHTVDSRRVRVIPHGVPAWATSLPTGRRRAHAVLTWGLIGPGKGIEHAIRAVALLDDLHPPVSYLVSGQTHPKVLAHAGEAYRRGLQALIDEHGLGDRVTLENRYLSSAELQARISAADAVLLPYDSDGQVTSGVLSEAVAAGRLVVSTTFPHAVEQLSDGRGELVRHRDPASMAQGLRRAFARSSYTVSSPSGADPGLSWAEIGRRYRELAHSLAARRLDAPA